MRLEDKLAERASFSKRDAKDFLNALREVILEDLSQEGQFVLPGFFKIHTKTLKARPASERFNIQTRQMEPCPAIEERTGVAFKSYDGLKKSII